VPPASPITFNTAQERRTEEYQENPDLDANRYRMIRLAPILRKISNHHTGYTAAQDCSDKRPEKDGRYG